MAKKKGKKVAGNTLKWLLALFMFSGCMVYWFSFASIIFALLGIYFLPIAPIQNFFKNFMPKKKILRGIIAFVIFFFGCLIAPATETTTPETPSTDIVISSEATSEPIKLALQGYNFGNGYISWAKTNYGGYSYANAVEFSTMQAARLGWDSYGDTQYPAHVLRYYPYGRAFTSGFNQAIVEVALTQLGNEGGQPYWSWYGFEGRVEWCACFVSWCADQCGYLESGIVPKFSLCSDGVDLFQGNGQWQDRNYEPSAGQIIFFDWEGDGETDHVGIVERCENGIVYTIEGNSGDACRQRSYPVGSSSIYGYGIPAY